MTRVLEAMDRDGRVPDSDDETWEDRLIAASAGWRFRCRTGNTDRKDGV